MSSALLSDRAIARIQELIVEGVLPPGSRLPTENELAAQLGISRSSIREAVKALTQTRVLDVRRGDGTYVTSLEPHLLLEGIGFALELVQDDAILEIVEVRRLWEPIATGLAAQRIDDSSLGTLAGHVTAMEAAEHDQEQLVHHDAAFHSAVFEATRNRTLTSILDGLASRTLRARVWRGVLEADAARGTIREHWGIYEALAAHDSRLAEARALEHVSGSERWLRDMLARRVKK
jgi:GntR family transcriptional regulator, transcriptional repressor for pyruvate dehydrogenase complex